LFEAVGWGAFQIGDWKLALAELFWPESGIVTLSIQRELKEKVDCYLAHPHERQEIAGPAYAHTNRENRHEIRLQKNVRGPGPCLCLRPMVVQERDSQPWRSLDNICVHLAPGELFCAHRSCWC